MHKNNTSMRVFDSMDELFEEVEKVNAMDEEELQEYEKGIGFQSFGCISESIYWEILKELGKALGYECLGDEEMADVDYEFTVEDAQMYVSQYPEYLGLMRTFSEESEEEYDFLPLYYNEPFRYIMNENRMFQVKETICKVFGNYIIATSPNNVNELFNITEANIEVIIQRIEADIVAGVVDSELFIFSAIQKGGDLPEDDGSQNSSRSIGPCGRSDGTYNRADIYLESPVASNNKEKVCGDFKCRTIVVDKNNTERDFDAWYSIYAKWRGCKKCVWIGCKRTLNTDFNIELWYEGNIYEDKQVHKTSSPVKEWFEYVCRFRTPINLNSPHAYTRGSIYNLCGEFWIATTSRSFNM